MKIIKLNVRPQQVGEITMHFATVQFDTVFEAYVYDRATNSNIKTTTDTLRLPATVFNAIIYASHKLAGEIASGLISTSHEAWWNMALKNAEINLNANPNDEEGFNEPAATEIVFAKDELTQNILKYGLLMSRGVTGNKVKAYENKIIEVLTEDIPEEI